MQAPITEEEKPAIEAMIRKLNRFRKRESAHNNNWSAELLSEAIAQLCEYREAKGWDKE